MVSRKLEIPCGGVPRSSLAQTKLHELHKASRALNFEKKEGRGVSDNGKQLLANAP